MNVRLGAITPNLASWPNADIEHSTTMPQDAARIARSRGDVMPPVEVFDDGDLPLFVGQFDFLPRVGDTISRDMDGYFAYHSVIEVWHRQLGRDQTFQACVRVRLDD